MILRKKTVFFLILVVLVEVGQEYDKYMAPESLNFGVL